VPGRVLIDLICKCPSAIPPVLEARSGRVHHRRADGQGPLPTLTPGGRLSSGDVLGAYLDLDRAMATFALNGRKLPWFRIPVDVGQGQPRSPPSPQPLQAPWLVTAVPLAGFYPAASLMTFQHVHFNFGFDPYRSVGTGELGGCFAFRSRRGFAPATVTHALCVNRFLQPGEEVRNLNGIGSLTADQRNIVPRLLLLQSLQRWVWKPEPSPRAGAAPSDLGVPLRLRSAESRTISRWTPRRPA
jgi:hypothetical protein